MKLDHFNYLHLPAHLQGFSKPFHDLAHELHRSLPQSAELNAGLRKLMEAKDCIVRAAIEVHGTRPTGDRMASQVASPTPGSHVTVDPITGNRLPEGSPYSMAHVPVTHSKPVESVLADHGIARTWYNPHNERVIEYVDGRIVRHQTICALHARLGVGCTCGAVSE